MRSDVAPPLHTCLLSNPKLCCGQNESHKILTLHPACVLRQRCYLYKSREKSFLQVDATMYVLSINLINISSHAYRRTPD